MLQNSQQLIRKTYVTPCVNRLGRSPGSLGSCESGSNDSDCSPGSGAFSMCDTTGATASGHCWSYGGTAEASCSPGSSISCSNGIGL